MFPFGHCPNYLPPSPQFGQLVPLFLDVKNDGLARGTEPSNNDYDNDGSYNCDHNFDDFGVKHRHRRNVTSHHFTSFLLTSFHFYVYYNFFCSYQLKSKYNTHTHIQQLNISLHSSSLLTLTSIIN